MPSRRGFPAFSRDPGNVRSINDGCQPESMVLETQEIAESLLALQ